MQGFESKIKNFYTSGSTETKLERTGGTVAVAALGGYLIKKLVNGRGVKFTKNSAVVTRFSSIVDTFDQNITARSSILKTPAQRTAYESVIQQLQTAVKNGTVISQTEYENLQFWLDSLESALNGKAVDPVYTINNAIQNIGNILKESLKVS